MYVTRLIAAIMLMTIICAQAVFSLMMIGGSVVVNDRVKLSIFDTFGAIDSTIVGPIKETGLKNYQRLDLGLCVFCAPEKCEARFEKYQLDQKNQVRLLDSFDSILEFTNSEPSNESQPALDGSTEESNKAEKDIAEVSNVDNQKE